MKSPLIFWSVAGLIALLFALTNLPWHLDDYDQAKQAFTSFEMVSEGHWLFQQTPNEKIATKPPLVGWISAGVYEVTRSWEVAWRLPSLAAAVALLIVLTRAAQTAYGAAAGTVAMGAFGLNLLSPRLATLVRTDMPLALVVFLIGLQIRSKIRGADQWSARERLVTFALLTAAMLIKGPIVYAFLLPGIAVFYFSKGRRYANVWCGWWPWLASLAIFLAWVGIGIARVPGFYDQVVLREFAGRFGESAHRAQPIYFYLPHLLHKFAPWSLLLIAFAFVLWRTAQGSLRERWRSLAPEIAWLICWSLGGLILMSLIPSKRVDRIFPVVAPLCLLTAALYREREPQFRKWSAIALVIACLFTTVYAGVRVVTGYRHDEAALVRFGAGVRRLAAEKKWRYEVMGGKEEGLLLYLRRPYFIKPAQTIERWNSGDLDALVTPAEESPRWMRELKNAAPSGLEASVTINGQPRNYLLLTHQP